VQVVERDEQDAVAGQRAYRRRIAA
jgi:hypothetical protein